MGYLNRVKYLKQRRYLRKKIKTELTLTRNVNVEQTLNLIKSFRHLINDPRYQEVKTLLVDVKEGIHSELVGTPINEKSEGLRAEYRLLDMLLNLPIDYIKSEEEVKKQKTSSL